MTSLAFTADTPFGDEDAFNEFLGLNEMAHQAIAFAMERNGLAPLALPLSGSPLDNQSWLLDHYSVHLSEGASLGIAIPDLSAVDLTDEGQFRDWMLIHANLHIAENLLLGIFS